MKTFEGLRDGTVIYSPENPDWGTMIVRYSNWGTPANELTFETDDGYYRGIQFDPTEWEIKNPEINIMIEDAKRCAINYMKDFIAYRTAGDINYAFISRGKAAVYEELLLDEGIDLTEENEHYKEMYNIWLRYKNNDR